MVKNTSIPASETQTLDTRIESVLSSPDMMFEDLVLDITGEVAAVMDAQNVSRSELARRIGIKPPHVTRLLQGGDNFTLRTLTRIAYALCMEVRCTLAPLGSTTRFVHTIDGKRETLQVESSNTNRARASFKSREFGHVVTLEEPSLGSTPSQKVG